MLAFKSENDIGWSVHLSKSRPSCNGERSTDMCLGESAWQLDEEKGSFQSDNQCRRNLNTKR